MFYNLFPSQGSHYVGYASGVGIYVGTKLASFEEGGVILGSEKLKRGKKSHSPPLIAVWFLLEGEGVNNIELT